MKNIILELNLLLIYLTGWEEDKPSSPDEKIFRAWRGYLFEVLEELEKEKLLVQLRGAQSLILTEKGRLKAEELKSKYI
jgi:hypothetical protein